MPPKRPVILTKPLLHYCYTPSYSAVVIITISASVSTGIAVVHGSPAVPKPDQAKEEDPVRFLPEVPSATAVDGIADLKIRIVQRAGSDRGQAIPKRAELDRSRINDGRRWKIQ
jgi:hypothetical protein